MLANLFIEMNERVANIESYKEDIGNDKYSQYAYTTICCIFRKFFWFDFAVRKAFILALLFDLTFTFVNKKLYLLVRSNIVDWTEYPISSEANYAQVTVLSG